MAPFVRKSAPSPLQPVVEASRLREAASVKSISLTKRQADDYFLCARRLMDEDSMTMVAFTAGNRNSLGVRRGRLWKLVRREELELLVTSKLLVVWAEYVADKSTLVWEAHAVFAACIANHVPLMERLLEEDPHLLGERTSSGSNLLWEAAFFGHTEIVRHLLLLYNSRLSPVRIEKAIEICTNFQGHNDIRCPVHCAAKFGHADILKLLAAANADIHRRHPHDGVLSPLESAIEHGHADCVQLLVEIGALCPPGQLEKDKTKYLDLALCKRNPFVLAAVAEGLKSASEEQVRLLAEKCPTGETYLVSFLSAPGSNAESILEAIFRKREPEDFLAPEEEVMGATLSHLFLEKSAPFNIALGGDQGENQTHAAFEQLLGIHKKHTELCNVDLYQCLLPEVHYSHQVLQALADNGCVQVFEHPGCQALVDFAWQKTHHIRLFNVITTCIVTILLFALAFSLNSRGGVEECSMILLMAFSVLYLLEIRKIVGSVYVSGFIPYCRTPPNLFSLISLHLCGYVACSIFVGGPDWSTPLFRACLGLVSFAMWHKLMFNVKGTKGLGHKIIPIYKTIINRHTTVLCGFMAIVLCAFIHMYYSLNLKDFVDSATTIFGLAVLGEFDLDKMQDVRGSWVSVSNRSTLMWADPDKKPIIDWVAVRIIFFLLGLTGTLGLITISIAVLNANYSEAKATAHRDFVRNRCIVALQDTIVLKLRKRLAHDGKVASQSHSHAKVASVHLASPQPSPRPSPRPTNVITTQIGSIDNVSPRPINGHAGSRHQYLWLTSIRQEKKEHRTASCALCSGNIWTPQFQRPVCFVCFRDVCERCCGRSTKNHRFQKGDAKEDKVELSVCDGCWTLCKVEEIEHIAKRSEQVVHQALLMKDDLDSQFKGVQLAIQELHHQQHVIISSLDHSNASGTGASAAQTSIRSVGFDIGTACERAGDAAGPAGPAGRITVKAGGPAGIAAPPTPR